MREFHAIGTSLLDPPGPGIWDALQGDPSLHFDRRALRLLERDQERRSRRWLLQPVRLLSRVTVSSVVLVKRLLPFEFSAHRILDRLGVWFMSNLVSEEGGELLLRHFLLETNLLNFIARNAHDGDDLPTAELRPVSLEGLGDDAILIHDLNVYALLHALAGRRMVTPERRTVPLDFSMLEVAAIRPGDRRWLRLDLETALNLMNIVFAICTTSEEYRRAVHSLQLDESLLGCLSEITGDATFRSWKPAGYALMVRTGRDVPRDLFAHAVIHEYAHARLLRVGEAWIPALGGLDRPSVPAGDRSDEADHAMREW